MAITEAARESLIVKHVDVCELFVTFLRPMTRHPHLLTTEGFGIVENRYCTVFIGVEETRMTP